MVRRSTGPSAPGPSVGESVEAPPAPDGELFAHADRVAELDTKFLACQDKETTDELDFMAELHILWRCAGCRGQQLAISGLAVDKEAIPFVIHDLVSRGPPKPACLTCLKAPDYVGYVLCQIGWLLRTGPDGIPAGVQPRLSPESVSCYIQHVVSPATAAFITYRMTGRGESFRLVDRDVVAGQDASSKFDIHEEERA